MAILGWTGTDPSGSGDEFGTEMWYVSVGTMPVNGTLDSVDFYVSFVSSPADDPRVAIYKNGASTTDVAGAELVEDLGQVAKPTVSGGWWVSASTANPALVAGDEIWVAVKCSQSSGAFYIERVGSDPGNDVVSPINYGSDESEDETNAWDDPVAVSAADAPANRWGGARIQYTETASSGPPAPRSRGNVRSNLGAA